MKKINKILSFILIVFLVIFSYLKSTYDHQLNSNLAQQFNKNKVLKSHKEGATHYLMKPFESFQALANKFLEVLENNQ